MAHRQRPIVFTLMWAETIIVVHIRLHDVVHVAETETEEVVQRLAFKGADPRFGETIRDRSLERCLDNSFAHVSEVFVEGFGELRVTVVDQEAKF